jgi:hypothetical protein
MQAADCREPRVKAEHKRFKQLDYPGAIPDFE